jgi:hypothetical protein
MTRDELIKHLQDYYKPDEQICAHLWTRSDVYDMASNYPNEITDEQADKVLELMERQLDSSLGVTWDTVDYYLFEVVPTIADEEE